MAIDKSVFCGTGLEKWVQRQIGKKKDRGKRIERGAVMAAHHSGDKLKRKREENVGVDGNKKNGMSIGQDMEEELK